jgi:hypothetical protein
LGVHRSTVRSATLDTWSAEQVAGMAHGGNAVLLAFFRAHGVSDDTPFETRYRAPAAELYRRRLAALRAGQTPPTALSAGELAAIEADNRAEAALVGLVLHLLGTPVSPHRGLLFV